ncbi:hypothetical protein [Hyalangium versicolor]|uniref:hypothetical protein n=1 Tax=Hyalangium versicolor TaxID=2861190 RepID=UPI001CCA24D4|nr:hypothetical protein [Hyalangium versicolor]
MKTHSAFTWILPLGCAALLSACDNSEPLPQCTIGRGEHAVRYVLVAGDGPCATKTAEKLGAQIFRTPGSGIPPSLDFKPERLATGKDTANPAIASGDFTTEYPSKEEELCVVPTMSEARQRLTQTDGSTLDVRYQFSNVRVQGSSAIPGTQWIADLTYTENDCTAKYTAVGMFPAIKCEKTVDNKPVRDPTICQLPQPGLSIDPAFPTTCDVATNLCVLQGEPPSLIHEE